MKSPSRIVPMVVALAAFVVFTTMSQAQTLLSDTFTYPNGPLVGASGSPWLNNSGTAGSLLVSGGAVFINDNATEDAQAPLSSTVVSGSISGTFDFRVDPADIADGAGGYFTHFRSSTNGFVGRVFTLAPIAGDAAGTFRLGLATNASTSNTSFSTAFTSGTTYSLTLTYDFSTHLASLAVEGFGSITATDAFTTANISSWGFRQTTNTGDMFIDNLVVTSIPEPSSILSLAFGTVALLTFRRFRRIA